MPATRPHFSFETAAGASFDALIADWLAVAFVANNLSRSLGQKDPYPFVLSEAVIAKLRFVHQVCTKSTPEIP
jgi:hypothetical protein